MGLICLQGGNEFAEACRAMDAFLLDAAGGGPVAVLPLASNLGREYDSTAADAVRHFTALGAAQVVVADPRRPLDALTEARLVVLPGGSPTRLRDAVRGTPLHDALRAAAADDDTVLMGSSAGAMLLCGWTVLPERGIKAAEGLGIVDDFAVIPHYARPRPDWENALRGKADLLGIPECSGVLIDGENVTAMGAEPTTLISDEGRAELAL
jgi:peptidase E